MAFRCEDLGSLIVLTYGERRLDYGASAEFREASRECIRSDRSIYILDLQDVTFVDSSGIGAIVGFLKHLGRDRRLELCGLNPMVSKVFKLTRLDKVFTIRKDREACLEAYRNIALAIS